MPRERAVSEVKEPHSISLKVLRLSRPSLSEQHPLPKATSSNQSPELDELSRQSHAYPSHPTDDPFILSPLLTLPPAFGNAYIGETFSCCLSANNETTSIITGVRISAEMQTPSLTLNLELGGDERQAADLHPTMSLQKIVKYDLKEEGSHILAVTVTYTEAPKRADSGEGGKEEVPGRVRTFRKLYQFIAQQCLTVRTKIGALPGGRAILEAQLENMGDGPISLDMVNMGTKRGWAATSLNWRGSTGRGDDRGDPKNTPMLGPRDVMQVAFLLYPEETEEKREEDAAPNDKKMLGQLSIEWRSACGDRGYLSTGRLGLHV